jgi:hypothetical protein
MQHKFQDDPQHWRWRAEEARVDAQLISDPDSRSTMLEIAAECERIAQRAEERMRDLEERAPASSTGRWPPPRKKRWF